MTGRSHIFRSAGEKLKNPIDTAPYLAYYFSAITVSGGKETIMIGEDGNDF